MNSGIVARRRGLFGPGSVANLQLWLRADDLATVDAAAVAGNWADQSGNGRNAAVHGTVTMRRNAINGHAALEFDGSSGYFQVGDAVPLRFQSRLYMAAVIISNGYKTILCKGDTAADPDYLWLIGRSADGGIGVYDGTAWRDGTAGVIAPAVAQIVEVYWDGTNMFFTVNGVAAGSPTDGIGMQTSSGALRIGAQGSALANLFDGKLAEIIMIGNGVADATGETLFVPRARIRSYLTRKYGITGPSEVTHLAAYNGGSNGTDYAIGVAAGDGVRFWKRERVVVDQTTGFEDVFVKDPFLVKVDGVYWMFYVGYDGSHYQIGAATSSDGENWSKNGGNPVLARGGSGAWDEAHVNFPFVVHDASDADASKRWKMWYSGSAVATPSKFSLGYATSPDGVTWTKSGANPLVVPGGGGTWDDEGVLAPVAAFIVDTWHLYFAGRSTTSNPELYALGHATASGAGGPYSLDGANPLLTARTAIRPVATDIHLGDGSVTIDDTSSFAVGEPILVKDLQADDSWFLTTITAVTSATVLQISPHAPAHYDVAQTATVRSAYYGSVCPRSLLIEGDALVLFTTSFQQFAGTPLFERSTAAKAASPGGPWTFDLDRGVLLPLGTWDTHSAENPAVILA